jgi:hypothetical protein
MPWEIMRIEVPISPSASASSVRQVDIYTKSGVIPMYATTLALSPDHGIGFALLTQGAGFSTLVEMIMHTWFAAAEAAAREAATRNFAGKYQDAGREKTFMLVNSKEGRAGLIIDEFWLDGKNMLEAWSNELGFSSAELWPANLEGDDGSVMFQVLHQRGMPSTFPSGRKRTFTNYTNMGWANVDDLYGGQNIGEFVFRVRADGKATALNAIGFRTGELLRVNSGV